MNAPHPTVPFAMLMFRAFVPRRLQPWIYVCIAVTFQLSGGLYLGTLSQMMGETALMREDLLMCLYANLAGMAIYFPLLFRMKFRFTNKTLLCAAAMGVLACNLLAPHIHSLPLLWTVCFVSGICKIQGTFECMSNIQLWMTPKRDFTVFFPVLHIIILGSMQVSDWLSIRLMYHYHWTYMHFFIGSARAISASSRNSRFTASTGSVPCFGHCSCSKSPFSSTMGNTTIGGIVPSFAAWGSPSCSP